MFEHHIDKSISNMLIILLYFKVSHILHSTYHKLNGGPNGLIIKLR